MTAKRGIAKSISVYDKPLKNQRPDLGDETFRARIIDLAMTGMSERGVAMAAGLSWNLLRQWISMGKAEPDIEPHGTFARQWDQAIRAKEVLSTHVLHKYQKKVAELAERPDVEAEDLLPHINNMVNIMRVTLPQDWGDSKLREVQPEITGDEFFQGKALMVGQIRGALRNPERALKEAILAEGDTVLQCLLDGEWKPSKKMAEKLRALLDQEP